MRELSAGIRDVLFGAAEEQIDQKESIDEAREEHHVVRLRRRR
jgi:hypothetical protein